MYDRTIPPFVRGLNAMSAILTKTEAHCAARRIDPAALLNFRLFPDMLPFTRQVQIATDHARRCPARLAGTEPLAMADTEASFADLQDRLMKTRANVESFTPASFEGCENRIITFKAGPRELSFSGADYVTVFAMPNFYFHMTTAYNILRHNGVEIGKTDFLGG
jgi:hypothetical protein